MDFNSVPLRHSPCTIVILLTAYLTVLVAGLVGNLFVIIVVVKIPRMKTASNYFILNLAIADLLVLIFCLTPSLITNIYVPWVMGSMMCKAVPYIQGVSVCASVYSLAAISGERLMAIWFPLRRPVTKSVARRIILLIWIWAAGLSLPWLRYFELITADNKKPSMVFCVESWPSGIYGNIYFVLVNLGLFYLCPLSFISFCQFRIWLRVRHRNVPTDSSVSQMELVHHRTRASVQKLVIVVVAGFAACWLPLYLICIRVKLIPAVLGVTEEHLLDYALPIAQWLGAANSCVNPVLYAFFNRNFRLALQRLLWGSPAYTTSRNGPNPYLHNHPYHAASRGTNGQLRNTLLDAVQLRESSVVLLHQNSRNPPAISRSQTCKFGYASVCRTDT